jgi:putative ABC transport system substrate-binding protein
LHGLVIGAAARGASAQSPAPKRRIGFLAYLPNEPLLRGFRQAMRDVGYVEGQNLEILERDGEGRDDLLARHAAELVREKVDLIVVWSTNAAEAAKRATTTIPILVSVADPLGSGLIQSLARPEANLTGVSAMAFEVAQKRASLLTEALPGLRRLAFLGLRGEANMPRFLELSKAAAAKTGAEMVLAEVRDTKDLEPAIAAAVADRVQGLVLQQIFYPQSQQLGGLTLKYRLPAIGWQRPFAEAGGLMAFGVTPEDNYARLARLASKLLAGTPPASLPVEQATRTQLVVNQRTARTLGVSLSPLVLAQADEAID